MSGGIYEGPNGEQLHGDGKPVSAAPGPPAPRPSELCNCAEWAPNIAKVNGPMITMALRRGSTVAYDGVPFRFCPWCGTPLNGVVLDGPESRGAPPPAMLELRAAAEEVVREMAYLFERDAQDDATLAANDIKDALAYRRLRAALTAQEPSA